MDEHAPRSSDDDIKSLASRLHAMLAVMSPNYSDRLQALGMVAAGLIVFGWGGKREVMEECTAMFVSTLGENTETLYKLLTAALSNREGGETPAEVIHRFYGDMPELVKKPPSRKAH